MKHYSKTLPQGTPKEIRRKGNVGDILINRVRCLHCKKMITSRNRHDFQKCSCGMVAVDGGSWYIRRIGTEGVDYKELSVWYDDDNVEEASGEEG